MRACGNGNLTKRKCGMGLMTARLPETAAHVIAMSILVLNLRRVQRVRLRFGACLRGMIWPRMNLAFVQQASIRPGKRLG